MDDAQKARFTVHAEPRRRWAWVVRWNGGKAICRADCERDARRIASELNTSDDLNRKLQALSDAVAEVVPEEMHNKIESEFNERIE